MLQQFALDRPGRPFYYLVALGLLAAQPGCGVRTEEIAPADLPVVSRERIDDWVSRFTPTRALRYELRWTYQTQQGSARGRAAVQFVPPDSVRFDYRAPFGRSGAAVIVGDEVLWSRPEEDVDQLIKAAPLFWAALGVPRHPSPDAALSGLAEGNRYWWRYALSGDTLTYAVQHEAGGTLRADMRRLGDVIGTVEVRYADSTLQPASSNMLFPGSASTVLFMVETIEPLGTVDPSIWKAP